MQAIASNGYSVFFDNTLHEVKSFIDNSNYSKIFILTDRNTGEHCLPVLHQHVPETLNYDIIEVDPGEENKNIDFCIGVWNMLLDFGADRNSLLINLGGGVVTDMGGFAASTFKRGIDFVQIPTTLLSQVDASVGGKTGIDLGAVKNIIGTFTQPKAVFISPEFLNTLDSRQLVSGFAEILKHGLIFDKKFFLELQTISPENLAVEDIYHSVKIKNKVVTADPQEKGLRKILNYGHTVGHAIESYSLTNDPNPLLHGEAIAVGMICEAYLSYKINGLSLDDLNHIVQVIRAKFPDYRFEKSIYPHVLEYMQNDKKNVGGKIGFALLSEIGKCDYNIYPSEENITDSLNFYYNLLND